jgi:HPt (histidine-containing phosphotransfer) domain-containing protein
LERIETDEVAMQKYIVCVHGIKGALWNIGEKDLVRTAHTLESCARSKQVEMLKSFTPEFTETLHRLLDKAESAKKATVVQNADRTSTGAKSEAELLAEKLREAKQRCADYNRKGTLDSLSALDGGNYSANVTEKLENIKESILQSEFETAELEIEQLIKQEVYDEISNTKLSQLCGSH